MSTPDLVTSSPWQRSCVECVEDEPVTHWLRRVALAFGLASALASALLSGQQAPGQSAHRPAETFRFRSGVDLVNVSVTVTDARGHFVPGLTEADFRVFDDGQLQSIAYFSAERVPISLGLVLDTSRSMAGEKIQSARGALDRFLTDLLGPGDEVFLLRFSDTPMLLQNWTTDPTLVSRALGRLTPEGATALYDAVARALPLALGGAHRKKALLIISDGNDTSSDTPLSELRQRIRESELLVYAIGIDGETEDQLRRPPPRAPGPGFPRPFPPPRGRGWWPQIVGPGRPRFPGTGGDRRVNVAALRDLTDASGGRTEIVRDARDLDPATAGIADELGRQYFLSYPATSTRDGRWHAIRVEVPSGSYRVRARAGYVADP
jgi:Ca-activated chloride channel homolog